MRKSAHVQCCYCHARSGACVIAHPRRIGTGRRRRGRSRGDPRRRRHIRGDGADCRGGRLPHSHNTRSPWCTSEIRGGCGARRMATVPLAGFPTRRRLDRTNEMVYRSDRASQRWREPCGPFRRARDELSPDSPGRLGAAAHGPGPQNGCRPGHVDRQVSLPSNWRAPRCQ